AHFPARQAADEQRALAHFGVQAEPPVGRVALPVPEPRQHGLELQAEPALQGAQALQLHKAHLAEVPGRDGGGAEAVERIALALEAERPAPEGVAEAEAAGGPGHAQAICPAFGSFKGYAQARGAGEGIVGAAVYAYAPGAGRGEAAGGEREMVDPV